MDISKAVNHILEGASLREVYYSNYQPRRVPKEVSQDVLVELSVDPDITDDQFNALVAELTDLLDFLDDFYCNADKDAGFIEVGGSETAPYYYSPETRTGVMTGDPEESYAEFSCEPDSLRDELEKLKKKYDFDIETLSCSWFDY